MQWLIDFVSGFWELLRGLVTFLIDSVMTIILLILSTVFEGFLLIVTGIINALDFGDVVVSSVAAWGLLDSNTAWMVSAVGIPQGLTILGSAYLIRLTLNLIPSWITRV